MRTFSGHRKTRVSSQLTALLVLMAVFIAAFHENDVLAGSGKLSKPKVASLKIDDDILNIFFEEHANILLRYLSGNGRWEVRKENGFYYAVRREKYSDDYPIRFNEKPDTFSTSLNGFYSYRTREGLYQTRVLLSFGKEYGFGREKGNITRVTVRRGAQVDTIIEGEHSGAPGNSSYIIFRGSYVNLEIYEQTPKLERSFTIEAFREMSAELNEVFKTRKDIKETGISSNEKLYPVKAAEKQVFNVNDGSQRGIYQIEAWVNLSSPGELYLKVFRDNDGARLSEERITPASIRLAGWSPKTDIYFPYFSEITVFEGDWSHSYKARFELWHKTSNGKETKIAEITREIFGWQR